MTRHFRCTAPDGSAYHLTLGEYVAALERAQQYGTPVPRLELAENNICTSPAEGGANNIGSAGETGTASARSFPDDSGRLVDVPCGNTVCGTGVKANLDLLTAPLASATLAEAARALGDC